MSAKAKTKQELVLEVQELRNRLQEADETLRAIRSGEVDALVVSTPRGEEIFTLKGAEQPYRVFVEAMNEGAATLDSEGTILFCNSRFAKMLNTLHENVVGSSIYQHIPPTAASDFRTAFQTGKREQTTVDISLIRRDDGLLPAQISLNPLPGQDIPIVCMVATDLTEHRRYEEEILKSRAELEMKVQERTAELTEVNEVLRAEIHERKRAEKTLQESEERLRRMIETSPVAIGFGDSTGRIFEANEAFYRITGYTREELQAGELGWDRLTAPEYAELDRQTMDALEATGSAGPYEKEYIRKDGKRVPLLLSVSKFPGRDEHIAFIVDISELKQTDQERELLRIEAENERRRLEALVRSIPDEVWFSDSAGQFTLVNPPGSREFDLGVGASIQVRQLAANLEVRRPDGTPRPIEEAPPLRALRGELVTNQEEWLRSPSTGELRYRQVSAAPVYDDTGNILGSVSVARDITEQKRAEIELQESEERLRRLIETSPVAIGFGDSEGKIFEANESFYRLTGYTREEIKTLELGWNHLTAPEYAEIDRQIMKSLAATASAGPYEKEYIRKDGSRVPLLLSVSKFPGRDEHVAFILDITERKREEQERERLRVEADNERRRLEAVMEALPVGVAVTDIRGGTVISNKAFEGLWGSPRPKTESFDDYESYKAWWSATGEPVAPEEWASVQAVKNGHAVVGQLLEIERFDGSRSSVINSGAPVFDANGKITGCAVAIQDVSDLRKIEKALRESNSRTETILESISDGFMTLDNDLVLTYFNQAAENLLGRKQEDVLGRKLFDAFPEARGSVFEEKYSWAVKAKKTTAFEAYFGVAPYENWYDVRVYPHEYGMSAYFRVTTEEKKAAEAIRKSKERFELLAETASRLLATSNPQGVVNELCQKVMTHLDCHAFFNYMVDPTKQRLHLNTCAGIPEQTAKDIEWLDYGVAVCGCAARDASRIVCENIPVTPDPRTELVKSFGIKAYACHPLFSEGCVMGTLSFGTRTRTAFTEDELSLMKTVADQVATAMERIRLLREVENSRDELEIRVLERTEQLHLANASLKAERQLFYDVLETIPAYVVLLTPDYHAAFANRTFKERFGESQGRRCFEFLFGRSEPCEVCETYTALKTMAPHQWEWDGPDGRIYFVHDYPFTDVDGSTLILEMGIDITGGKRAEQELVSKEKQLRLFASQYLNAQETERRRIAVELHDSIASSLAGIKFRVEKSIEDMKGGLYSTESLKDLSSNLGLAIGEVRRIMADLRPSILDDLGILPALNWLCREFMKTYSHITIEKSIGVSEEEVPDLLKTMIFRISQEAMNNIAKHSEATLVGLILDKAGERVELTIHDNGRGFLSDEIKKGLGLSTMRERAELSGGAFSVESAQGKGTTIRASWPLTL